MESMKETMMGGWVKKEGRRKDDVSTFQVGD
jgi:hypothetical protein